MIQTIISETQLEEIYYFETRVAMAAPGYDMYYLNVMAGPGPVREWLIIDDPRLPFGA